MLRCTRHLLRGSLCKRHKSDTGVKVLHQVIEEDPFVKRVEVTMGDNPNIIVCHHPPNKIAYNLTKPAVAPVLEKEDLTDKQRGVAKQLLTDHPLVWGRASVAELFNVSIQSVQRIKIYSAIEDKREISQQTLKTWSADDREAFRSYISKCRYDTRNQLLQEDPSLFQFCEFNREEELIKIKLCGLNCEFPEVNT